jgi:hypothetical protein
MHQLLGQLGRPARISLPLHPLHQLPVLRTAGKIPAAAQQKGLFHRLLEMPMRRLHITIFIAAGRVGRFRLHPVMSH